MSGNEEEIHLDALFVNRPRQSIPRTAWDQLNSTRLTWSRMDAKVVPRLPAARLVISLGEQYCLQSGHLPCLPRP